MPDAGGSQSASGVGGGSRKGVSRTALPQTSHDVSIYVFAGAICESSVGSLYLEPELLVEGFGGCIICIYAEIQPRKTQPVVCEVEANLHQRGADAPSLPTIPYCYPKVSRVSSPRVHVDT